jgi:riboflavin transporter FmnP
MALVVTHRSLSNGVMRACGGGMVSLEYAFFFPLYFLSFGHEIRTSPSKKQLCPPVCILTILTIILLIAICFAFDFLFNLDFFFKFLHENLI